MSSTKPCQTSETAPNIFHFFFPKSTMESDLFLNNLADSWSMQWLPHKYARLVGQALMTHRSCHNDAGDDHPPGIQELIRYFVPPSHKHFLRTRQASGLPSSWDSTSFGSRSKISLKRTFQWRKFDQNINWYESEPRQLKKVELKLGSNSRFTRPWRVDNAANPAP